MAIVFYDGKCGLCQRSIQFLDKADKKKQLFFAPLNGVTYKQIYGQETAPISSVKLYYQQQTYEKSSAFLKLSLILGGRYKILYLFVIVPAFIRNAIYDFIAMRRKEETCFLVKKDERFLS